MGKSTLCRNISDVLGLPFYSAGDLISEVNGEVYGSNKVVKDKLKNQDILTTAVNCKLEITPSFILAGHFCIFNARNQVDVLPEFVFSQIHISKIILLQAPVDRIIKNIQLRDEKTYSREALGKLIAKEQSQAVKVAKQISAPLFVHQMKFEDTDSTDVIKIIEGSAIK